MTLPRGTIISGEVSVPLPTNWPVVVAHHNVNFGVIAELDLFGQVLKLGIVRPGLNEQHVLAMVFGKPAGDNRAGGAGPNHDVVILHNRCAPCVAVARRRAGRRQWIQASIIYGPGCSRKPARAAVLFLMASPA